MNDKDFIDKIDAFLALQIYPEDVEDNIEDFMNAIIEKNYNSFGSVEAQQLMVILADRIDKADSAVMRLKYISFIHNLANYLDNIFCIGDKNNGNTY